MWFVFVEGFYSEAETPNAHKIPELVGLSVNETRIVVNCRKITMLKTHFLFNEMIEIMIERKGGWERYGWTIKYIERKDFDIWFI